MWNCGNISFSNFGLDNLLTIWLFKMYFFQLFMFLKFLLFRVIASILIYVLIRLWFLERTAYDICVLVRDWTFYDGTGSCAVIDSWHLCVDCAMKYSSLKHAVDCASFHPWDQCSAPAFSLPRKRWISTKWRSACNLNVKWIMETTVNYEH